MPKQPKILAFAGSLREKSFNKRVLKVGGVFDGDTDEITNDSVRIISEELGKSLADMLRKTHGEVEVVASAASNIGNN